MMTLDILLFFELEVHGRTMSYHGPIESSTIIYEDNSTCVVQMETCYIKSNINKHICWGLVLKCYELRTRKHTNRLMVNALRPAKHYFPKDIMIFGRRL
jgi:hypothetical protein